MAITVQRIKDYLASKGIKHAEFAAGGEPYLRFDFTYGDKENEYDIRYAILLEEKSESKTKTTPETPEVASYEFLQLRGLGFADKDKVRNSDHLDKLCKFLLQENYNMKIGTWGLDFEDGDLYVSIVHSLEDNDTLTDKQLDRMVGVLTKLGKETQPRIRGLLETGNPDQYTQPASKPQNDQATQKLALLQKLFAAGKVDLASSLANFKGTDEQLSAIEQATEAQNWAEVERLLAQTSLSAVPDEL